jgi:hypothetical protein
VIAQLVMSLRTRFSFMIDRDLLYRLRAIQARTGLSVSQQIREGIRWWVEARQWPDTRAPDTPHPAGSGEPDLV